MFTNIDQEKTMELVKELLASERELQKRTPIKIDDILALLQLDLSLAYFRWQGSYYQQLKGFGMGKSTSSPPSDIFMEDFEAKALAQYPTGDNSISPSEAILFWFRKADDTITAIQQRRVFEADGRPSGLLQRVEGIIGLCPQTPFNSTATPQKPHLPF